MGTFTLRGKSSGHKEDETELILEETAVGTAGKTFVEQYWKLKIYMIGAVDTTWNVKVENVTKSKTVLNLTNKVLMTQELAETIADLLNKGKWNTVHNSIFSKDGTDNEHWIGDTVKLTLTKVSGDTPSFLKCVIGTEAKYSD